MLLTFAKVEVRSEVRGATVFAFGQFGFKTGVTVSLS